LKWSNGEYPNLDPSVVRRVGFEDEEPQVIIIEYKPDVSIPELTVHSSRTLFLDWKNVAFPIKTELEPDITLDRFWHKIRFVGPYLRPFVTMATSFNSNSVCFPMTFFIDTGSPVNFLKESVFDNIPATIEKIDTGEKMLYLGGKRFEFQKSPKNTVHSNLNLLGTPVLYTLDFLLQSLIQAIKQISQHTEEGRSMPPESSDWK